MTVAKAVRRKSRSGFPGSEAMLAPTEFTREPYSLRIEMDGLPKINAADGLHWRTRRDMREAWENRVWAMSVNRKPVQPLQAARVTVVRHSSSEPDYDGLVQTGKWLIDALVKIGILADDAPSVIGVPTYRWQQASPREGKVTLYVEEPIAAGVEIGPRVPAMDRTGGIG